MGAIGLRVRVAFVSEGSSIKLPWFVDTGVNNNSLGFAPLKMRLRLEMVPIVVLPINQAATI